MKDYTLLHDFVKTLKRNKFKVYTSASDENYYYCMFEKNNKLGYVECGYFGGLRFSTIHKGNKNCGTGFGLNDDPGTFEPTVKDAEGAFIFAPHWAKKRDIESVVKYKDYAEYESKPVNQILKRRQL